MPEMSEAEREKWLAQARALQAKVDAAHEAALRAADAKERATQKSLQAARAELHRIARAANEAGFTEARIGEVIKRSGTAIHYMTTKTIPTGSDPGSQRRAAKIRERIKGEKKR
jgi:multidrug efflux pump subunit AcrA (membrane-fusion protein)